MGTGLKSKDKHTCDCKLALLKVGRDGGDWYGIYLCCDCKRLWKIFWGVEAVTDGLWLQPGEAVRGYAFRVEEYEELKPFTDTTPKESPYCLECKERIPTFAKCCPGVRGVWTLFECERLRRVARKRWAMGG